MKLKKLVHKGLAIIVGLPILVVGLIFIPLPGPGLLITFAGLLILSTAFDFLRPYVKRIKLKLKAIIYSYKQKQDEINKKYK